MQRIIFSEEYCRHQHLYPFTYIRQMVDIRVGILTIREKWEKLLGVPSADKWEDTYKDGPGAVKIHPEMEEDDCLLLHSNIIPTRELADAVLQLKPGQALSSKDHSGFAFRFTRKQILGLHKVKVEEMLEFEGQVQELQHPWQLFEWNDQEIRKDFQLITNGRKSAQAGESNKLYHPDNIFIEPGAVITGASLNAKTGPIYIGKNAEVMEGALIRGSFALCDNAVVKMGTKIYGATTVGPYSVVGGEIKNSILMGYSNKAHDGYLGDAVIGEWCNIGAGSSCSNLKNNASSVRIWNYYTDQATVISGKCGLMMGDYSRAAINTSFNTGTVCGICCNIFGDGIAPKYIPNFSWGSEGVQRYQFDKAIEDISRWKKLKNKELEPHEIRILQHIFDNTAL